MTVAKDHSEPRTLGKTIGMSTGGRSRGRPMKAVCRVLECARSHIHALDRRADDWRDGRTCRTSQGDTQLLAEIRAQIADLPSCG